MAPPLLLAVPNASVGADPWAIDAIGAAFSGARLLDVHSDPDHGRSVFTLAARQGDLASALVAGAREVLDAGRPHRRGRASTRTSERSTWCPWSICARRIAAPPSAEALTVAARLGSEPGLPVFLYGGWPPGMAGIERADLRRGGRGRAERPDPDR